MYTVIAEGAGNLIRAVRRSVRDDDYLKLLLWVVQLEFVFDGGSDAVCFVVSRIRMLTLGSKAALFTGRFLNMEMIRTING